MKTKQRWWIFKKKTQEFLISKELKNNSRVIKGALLSIIAGFIVAGIVISVQNVNPFQYYGNLFKIAFNGIYISQTLQWFSVYIVAGLSIAVGFKTGLFNIGVSGQMLAGAGLGTVIFNLVSPGASSMSGGMVFLIFIVCVLMGTILAGFAGWLKAMFNIHEVVSTIMLNWMIWYLFKFVFLKWTKNFTPNGVATNPFPQGLLNLGSSEIVVPILIALATVFVVWVIFAKTVFGFRLKAVGSSTTVSKYAGINVKRKIVASMAISGALAGVASFINIFTVSPNISFGIDNLPTVGYDAIAVSLVAFNNPIGIIGVAFLWGIVQSAGGSAASLFNMPSQMSLLIFGIIVYFAAIAVVFIKWAPGYAFKLRYYIWNSKLYKSKAQELSKKILEYRWWMYEPSRNKDYKKAIENFKQRIKVAQSDLEIKEIKLEMKNFKFDFKESCKLNLNKYETQLKNYKNHVYLKEINHGMRGIKNRAHIRINKINEQAINNINLLKLELVKIKDDFYDSLDQVVNNQAYQFKELKSQFKKDKNALLVWKEGQLGEIKLDFELSNGRVAAKGEYSKQKNILEEEIRSAHSDQRLKFHLLKFDESLTSEEKRKEKIEIKKITAKQIKKIKLQIKKIKQNLNQEVGKLKLDHFQRGWELRKNPTKIVKIEEEYQLRLAKINDQYQQNLQLIKSQEFVRVTKFDLQKSGVDLETGQRIFNECLEQLNDLKFKKKVKGKKELVLIQEQLVIVQDSITAVYKVFGRHKFKNYDDNQTIKEKTKIFIKLAELEHLYNVQLEIVKTELTLKSADQQNDKIINNYKKELVAFKNEYKKNLQAIKKQKTDSTPKSNYQAAIIENEQVYFEKINDYIKGIEKTYTTVKEAN